MGQSGVASPPEQSYPRNTPLNKLKKFTWCSAQTQISCFFVTPSSAFTRAVMPASLYQSHYNTSCMERIQGHGRVSSTGSLEDLDNNRSAWKAAADLINLLGFTPTTESFGTGPGSSSGSTSNLLTEPGLSCGLGSLSLTQSQLEQQKQKQSQNMTECVPVPTSEHVAEIVGRQGCKIKALRAKTNTYIKTPVRGDEPVFVVTGRKEDVGLAKREILSAAEHFSQIRASRKTNSTVGYGNLNPNQPGQTTIQVRVPYRVVGLVVGPKGATIKRIQQQTQTYIVTPSRDKEPVFEVTGQPEMVDAARKEIEAHIELRTGAGVNDNLAFGTGSIDDNLSFGFNSCGGSGGSMSNGSMSNGGGSNNGLISDSSIFNAKFPGESTGKDSVNSISRQLSNGLTDSSSFYNNVSEMPSISRLKSLLDSNNTFDPKFDHNVENKLTTSSISSLWRNSDSSWRCSSSGDSGLGHSPPFDFGDSSSGPGAMSTWSSAPGRCGPRDSPIERHSPLTLEGSVISKSSNSDLTPRSASIDLGIPGNMLGGPCLGIGSDLNSCSSSTDSGSNQTNSLPYSNPTLRNLISASYSSSLETLSMNLGVQATAQESSTDKLLEGLASNLSRQATISPVLTNSDQINKPLGLW